MIRLSGPWYESNDTCGGHKSFRRNLIATQPAGLADITVEVPDPGPDCCLKGRWQPTNTAVKAFVDLPGPLA
ncbi:hypothetical protein EI545_15060 [Tabrizicola piscis]|uniref:Uncharacterized protein n=1 Tax=Tabrizicola piscis TaxID=2494374 RepID=A0A3S8U8Y9_9RHOB|nr:hypothetical protein [Tabrizicola piscis]AZL60033.1 hypothetical protein EI545_15060 [Tabrizicola piscis]